MSKNEAPLQKKKNCDKIQEKRNFFFVEKNAVLIHIHMASKPMQ